MADQLQIPMGLPLTVAGFLEGLIDPDAEQEPLLVAVDQAQYVSLEGYQLLRQLILDSKGAIRLLLAGEYQLQELVQLAGFESGEIKTLELESLSCEETGDYLLELLCAAGYAGEQPLAARQLSELHQQSGGNISEINRLAPSFLMAEQLPAQGSDSHSSFPLVHIAAATIILTGVVFSYFYLGDDKDASLPVDTDAMLLEASIDVGPIQRIDGAGPIAEAKGEITKASESASRKKPVKGVSVEEIVAAERVAYAEGAIDSVNEQELTSLVEEPLVAVPRPDGPAKTEVSSVSKEPAGIITKAAVVEKAVKQPVKSPPQKGWPNTSP